MENNSQLKAKPVCMRYLDISRKQRSTICINRECGKCVFSGSTGYTERAREMWLIVGELNSES